ncbi:DUF4232 domain-containing protein [Kutzneria sp. NPDC052558]|uniref:DUF4232 domain-containing protein n=1 Tax=Kutzneria sp. NPDC052558 TaxID=3364121 RepID=UPI0037C5AA82
MTRSFGIGAVAGVMAVGLLTAACGSPSSTNASSDTSTTSSAPATSTASSAPATSSQDTGTNTASGAGGDGSGGASAANGQCISNNLKVTVGDGNAGAGHEFLPIVFTNAGAKPCTIAAYPGVSFVAGDDGHQVGDPATREPASAPTITLQPGQAASAALSIANVGVYDPAQCKPVSVRGLRVYPPNNTAALFVPLSGDVQGCSGHVPNQTPLQIKPMVAGANAQ